MAWGRVCWLLLVAALVGAPSAAASGNTYSLTAQPSSAAVGQPVTLTASISPGGAGETVTFFNPNGGPISGCTSVPVTSTGSGYAATCQTSFRNAGTNHLQAFFSDHSSASLDYTVTPAGTAVQLTSSIASPVVGEPFTLTASLSGSGPYAGTIDFSDNGAAIGTCTGEQLAESHPGQPPWHATCQVTFATPGSHSFVASYSGDSSNAPATSAPLALGVSTVGAGQLAVCPGQDTVVSGRTLSAAPRAVLCLLNEVRARYGVPALVVPPALESYAQLHPFGRVPAAFRQGAGLASTIPDAAGHRTPYDFVAALMRVRQACDDVLSENEAGIGVVPQALVQSPPARGSFAFAEGPTWTLLLVATAPAANPAAASTCPHPLPVDAVGRGAPRKPHAGTSDLVLFSAQPASRSLTIWLASEPHGGVTATLAIRVGRMNVASLMVRRLRPGPVHKLKIAVTTTIRRALRPGAIVTVVVHERSPSRQIYLFELRL